MAVATSSGSGRSWMTWALWIAGAALLFAELNTGLDYFQAGLQQNMGNLLGWAPAMGMITLKLAQQSIWHWSTVWVLVNAVPISVLGLLLVGVGLAIHGESVAARERGLNQ